MTCPRCTLRLLRASKPEIQSPQTHRAFSTTRPNNRLGAFTYAQEWQTGTYHYNKQTPKTLPVATAHTNRLLQAYATMRNKGAPGTARTANAAQRYSEHKVYMSKSTARDYGEKMVVDVFVYDGVALGAQAEADAKAAKTASKGTKGARGQKGKPGKPGKPGADGRQRPGRGGGAAAPRGGGQRGPARGGAFGAGAARGGAKS